MTELSEKLHKAFTSCKKGETSETLNNLSINVRAFLLPLPRKKVLTLYGLVYLSIALSVSIVFFYGNKELVGGFLLAALAMVLAARKSFCDKEYLLSLCSDNTLRVNTDSIDIPPVLTSTGTMLKIPKQKVKKVIIVWNYRYSLRSNSMYHYHHVFSINIELFNNETISLSPNSIFYKAFIYQLLQQGYHVVAEQVDQVPLKDLNDFFLKPMTVVFVGLIIYGIYTLFLL